MGKVVALVFHGMGKPEPGAVLNSLCSNVLEEASGGEGELKDEEWSLPDARRPSSAERLFFSSRVKRGTLGQDSVVLAEFHWADLSRVHKGALGFVRALFDLLFDLKPLRAYALRGREESHRLNRWLSDLVSFVVRGPFVAANCLVALLAVSWLLINEITKAPEAYATQAAYGAAAAGLALGVPLARRRGKRDIGISLALGGLALAALVTWYEPPNHPYYRYGFCIVYVGLLAFFAAHLLLFVNGLSVAIDWLCRRKGLESARVAFLSSTTELAMWVLLVPLLWEVARRKVFPEELLDAFLSDLIRRSSPLAGAQYLLCLAYVLAILSCIAHRAWKARSRGELPRLIVSKAFEFSLLFASLATLGLWEPATLFLIPSSTPHLAWPRSEFEHLTVLVGSATALLFGAVSPKIRQGLNLAGEITAYVATEPDSELGVRRRIDVRFDHLLERALKEEPTRLILVGHGQGSVILIDGLLRRIGGLSPDIDLRLVTFGSPIGHLFQHYFPAHYDQKWSAFDQRVIWRDLRHLDDPIAGEAVSDISECVYRCEVLEPGGHDGYWEEAPAGRAVLAALQGNQ